MKKITEQIALFIIAYYTQKSSREDLRVANNDNGSFVSLYARFILIRANSNLSEIAPFFFLQSICLMTGAAMGHERPGRDTVTDITVRESGSESKKLAPPRRGKGRQMKRDAYNLPISLLNLHPPGSSTSQCLLLVSHLLYFPPTVIQLDTRAKKLSAENKRIRRMKKMKRRAAN